MMNAVFWYVQKIDHTRYLKLAIHGYVHGTRRQGRPKKRQTDMVTDDCKQRDPASFGMEQPRLAAYAHNRDTMAISQVSQFNYHSTLRYNLYLRTSKQHDKAEQILNLKNQWYAY